MDVAQLSRGRLKGSFRLGGSRQLPVLSIQTNQDLLLQGNRRPGVLPLSWNTTDQLPVVRGKETQPCSLHGFHAGLSDAFVQLPAGAHIQVVLVSQTRFEQLATATGDHQTLEVIQLRQPPPPADGFQSRNHFARDYRNQFGESPSATLQRVSAPGMSVQSVSVAQSPQMAMALR